MILESIIPSHPYSVTLHKVGPFPILRSINQTRPHTRRRKEQPTIATRKQSGTEQLQAMIAAAVAEAVATAMGGNLPTVAAPEKPTKPSRKNGAKSGAQASSARKPAKKDDDAKVWKVRKSWKGEQASAKMMGAALHYGLPAAKVSKCDKYALSRMIGEFRVGRGDFSKIEEVA